MSLQISYQKANKTSFYKDTIVVRRFEYDKETKKTKAGKVILSSRVHRMPDEIPAEKIKAHSVTIEEQEQYKNAVKEYKEEHEKLSTNTRINSLTRDILFLKDNLSDKTGGIDVSLFDDLDSALKELKAEIARLKKNEKKRNSSK